MRKKSVWGLPSNAFGSLEIVLNLLVRILCLGFQIVKTLPKHSEFLGCKEKFIARSLPLQGKSDGSQLRIAGTFAAFNKFVHLIHECREAVLIVANVVHRTQDASMELRTYCPLSVDISCVDFNLRVVLFLSYHLANLDGSADAVHGDAVFTGYELYGSGIVTDEAHQGTFLSAVW